MRIKLLPLKFFIFSIALFFSFVSHAQVGIGTTTPANGSLLDIEASDKGLLIPRVSLTGITDNTTITPSATKGLLVFNQAVTTGANAVTEGFYYWDGTKWVALTTPAATGDNIYTVDGTLAEDRVVSQEDKKIEFTSVGAQDAFTLRRSANANASGLAFRNSGSSYDASVYMESGTNTGLAVATGGNNPDITTLGLTAVFNNDQTTSFSKSLSIYENVANLNDVTASLYSTADDGVLDLFENNTYNHRIAANGPTIFNEKGLNLNFRVETDADENTLFIQGSTNRIGIKTATPQGSLHVYEDTGTTLAGNAGTIVLEHGNAGGQSSILFKSSVNAVSDYGYIKYSDDGSGNGSTTENSLLEIGVQNDGIGANQDDINITPTGNLGISNTAPKEKLHIGGANSTIRVDGLNRPNNTNNVQNDPMPVYVDDNGTMVLQPSLVQTFMPVNEYNFTTGVNVSSSSGAGASTNLYTSTITLTQASLVFINYQFSAQLFRSDGSAITDGKPRLFRGWVEVNGDSTKPYAFDTGTYANRPDSNGTYANGFYYLSGSTYVQLPAGTHTIRLYGLGFGGNFDFLVRFGGTDFEQFQIIVQR
ncbi:hypothetical protein [Leeuwenhoekiella sp. MAR_2009_132]|uniref:hypothetical protein n=1 Tax=Leeuwenhoekiella sp. MAR_2009_132 TaxID=1392489 RepID=UPI0004913694|nr:hypothetical protein [Leeuwenhoekiella sp. MAR_2009_132]